MKNTFKNLKYWLKRLIQDTLLKRYIPLTLNIVPKSKIKLLMKKDPDGLYIDEQVYKFLVEKSILSEMSVSQLLEDAFKKYIKKRKVVKS